MENIFLKGFVCWRHERAQWEYEARSCNWIWLDKFTSNVINTSKGYYKQAMEPQWKVNTIPY